MSKRKQHAYQVALRMAQAKEVRAQLALASAVKQEAAAQEHVGLVEAMCQSVSQATHSCVAGTHAMDMARYELLTQLSAVLSDQLRHANDILDEGSCQRREKASENVLAKRHRELIGEHLDHLCLAMTYARVAKAQEESVELWLECRGEQP
ncbi:hypothetical protein ISP15_17530 [Dyella jejuensis]|uniref:Uncharacterized protein n=1 Tax=Dyella jejuensis TaxID=1432009 RepID=A0ABW8JPG8_9GAMM